MELALGCADSPAVIRDLIKECLWYELGFFVGGFF